MMDSNGRRSIRSVSDVEGNDWRNNLSSSARKSVVLKLIQKLKSCVPEPASGPDTLSEINRVAAEFEEKMYHESKTMEDYKTWICQRMMMIEESYNQTTSPRPSNSGNSFGQAMQSNVLANTKGEMPGYQPLQQGVFQPQQRQSFNLLKQNVQLPSSPSSFNQNKIHYSHDRRQKTEPIQRQTSQQPMLSTQPQQQQMLQRSHTTVFQHNQQLGQQGRISQHHQQPSQQKIPNSLRQPFSPQSNFSGLLQQQKLVGSQLDVLNMQLHQHSVHVLQQPEVKSAQQKAPQTLQSIQLHQLQSFQKQNNMESMPQRLHSSTFLSQSQSQSHNVVEQQKQLFQSQKVLTEASSESKEYTTQTQNADVPDCYDQAYQKIDKMRQNYLHIFCDEQRKTKDLLLQATEPDVVKLKSHMQFLEKGEMFLKLSRTGIECHSMENIVQFGHKINEFLSSIKRKSTTSVLHQNQPFQIPGGQSQMPQSPQHRNIKLQFHPGNGSLRGTSVGSRLLLSKQPGVPDSKINAINSLQSGSQMESEQGTAPTSLQHGCAMSIHQKILCEPQFTNSINNASVNSPHIFTDFILPSSNSPQQYLKEQQKHQPLQQQKLEQQVQQQKIQQKARVQRQKIQQETRRLQPQRIYEMNDLRVRQLLGVSSGIFQQHHSTSQQLDSDQLQLPSTPSQPQTTPDMSQHYSLKVDQKNLLQPFLKAGMPLQSTSSPFVVTSPSPLTPSTMRVELEKCPSDVSPLSIAENAGHHKTPIAVTEVQTDFQIQNNFFLVSTPGLSASPLLTEFTGLDGNQPPPATEKPLDRLLKAVNSISHEALSESVCDIGSIVSMIDRIAEKPPNQYSRGAIGEDLPSKTRRRLQARNFRSQYGLTSAQRTKRHITAITFDPLSSSVSESESFKQLSGQVSDLESTATSSIKRRRIEPNDAVLKEIRDVNQRLVETVVDVVLDSNEDVVITKSSEGTIVRFSYKAVALNENMKWCTTPQFFPTLHLLLLVPTNYPNSSPTLVNNLDWRYESEESQDALSKAKSRFDLSLCKLPNPMSIEEMAITWDACAREVFFEHAQLVGGERLASKYGTWEACVTA